MGESGRRATTRAVPIVAALLVLLSMPVHPASATLVASPNVEWARLAASTTSGIQAQVTEMDHDGAGNSFVLASYRGEITVGDSPSIVVPVPTPSDNLHGLLATYDPAGAVRWAQPIASPIGVSPIALAVDPSGTSSVLVTIFDTVTFGSGPSAITVPVPQSGSYAALATFDPAGTPVRASLVSATGYFSPLDLAVSATGEISVLGSFSTGVTLPPTLTPAAPNGLVVIRYDATGSVQWALPHSGSYTSVFDAELVDDGTGALTLAEAVQGTFSLGTGPGAGSWNLAHSDIVIARIDASGTVAWTATRGAAANDRSVRLAAAPGGGVSLAWHEDPSFVDWDEYWVVAAYSAAGTSTWNQTIGGYPYDARLTVTTDGASVVLARNAGNDYSTSFGSAPDDAVITGATAMAAFDATGALQWATAPGSRLTRIDANGSHVGVMAEFSAPETSTTIGEGAGAATVAARDWGNLAIAELSTSTGIATNLAVTADPSPLSLTAGASGSTRITVRNTGSTDAPAVHVALSTGAGLTVVGATPTQGSVTGLDWSAGVVPAGGSAYVDVDVQGGAVTGCVTPDLTANASFAGYDTNVTDNKAAVRVRVAGGLVLPKGATWLETAGGLGADTQSALASDPRGGAVTAGSLEQSAVFGEDAGSDRVSFPSTGRGVYVASYRADGSLRFASGGHTDTWMGATVTDVGVDASGAITAVGEFRGTLTLDGAPAVALVSPVNANATFLAHWGADGSLAWATSLLVGVPRVAVAPAGDIFFGARSYGGIVNRYTPSGTLVWSRLVTAQSYATVDDIIVDASLSPVFVGDQGGNFAVGPIQIAPYGAYLAKLGPDGVPLWAVPVPDTGQTSTLAFLPSGDLVRAGNGASSGVTVERFTATGAPVWSRKVTSNWPFFSSTTPVPIVTSPDGGVFVGAASFTQDATQPVLTPVGSGAAWFARLDPSTGTMTFLVRSPNAVNTLAFDTDATLLVGGDLVNSSDPLAPCAIGVRDVYVAKYPSMFTLPHLTGTVTGPDGNPAAGVTVTVMRFWPTWLVSSTVVTDANGHYDVTVVPGTYRIRFFDRQGRFARQWYNTAPTYRVADDLVVDWNAGAIADQQLAAASGGAISGTVINTTTGRYAAGSRVQIFTSNGYVAGAEVNLYGHFKVSLPPGSYWVRYVDPTRTLYSSWYGGVNDFPSAVPVVVTNAPVVANGTLGPWPTGP